MASIEFNLGVVMVFSVIFLSSFWLSVGAQVELVLLSSNITVQTGEGALLLCVGYSPNNTELTISWNKKGQALYNSSSSVLVEEDLVQGGRMFRQSYLQLCNLQYFDSGEYTCSVTNGTHSAEGSLELEVKGFAKVVVLSNDTMAQSGGSALLICTGFSRPHNSSNITWMKDNQELSNSSTVYIWEEDNTEGGRLFLTSFLALCELQHADSGEYTCIVSNGEQSDNSTTNLYVPDDTVEIIAISNKTTGIVGGSALLVCVAFGRPEATVSIDWNKWDQAIVNSTDANIIVEDTTQQNRTFKQSFIHLCNLKYGDTGTYTCSVGNGVTFVTSTVEVFITSTLNQGSNSIRETCSSGLSARDSILSDVLQLISQEKGVNLIGLTRDYAATSCGHIARDNPHRMSGMYWISHRNGTLAQELCTF